MVPSGIGPAVAVLFAALVIDRLLGDPQTLFHPVALLGRFIKLWGKPKDYPARVQRFAGVVFWIITVTLFALPFYLAALLSPPIVYLCIAPFLLKCCFAWRALEEHTRAVITALHESIEKGREKARLLVSRETAGLGAGQVRSAAYESLTENLTDSIISPLCFFCLFGITGAATYRASNTMDAMLGYRDGRERLGWFSARMDDVLNYIPARITACLLLCYFTLRGRFVPAVVAWWRDGRKRPGFNGGIVMAVMAGGAGVQFEKPGYYTIGYRERSLEEAGAEITNAARFVILFFAVLAGGTLFLLGSPINNLGI